VAVSQIGSRKISVIAWLSVKLVAERFQLYRVGQLNW